MIALFGFGEEGWGWPLLLAVGTTLSVSLAALALALLFGLLGAAAKLAGGATLRAAALAYTTIFRGVPDLLVIYLLYFGGSAALGRLAALLGARPGFIGLNAFGVGALAVGAVSGAYMTETLRGAYLAIPRGEIEAGRAVGMGRALLLRRIAIPRALRFALPGIGNIWQAILKESALVSVTGLVEIMRQVEMGATITGLPFDFYIAGAALFLLLTTLSGGVLRGAEYRASRFLRGPG